MSTTDYSIAVKGPEGLAQAHALAVACYGKRAEPPEWWEWQYFGPGAGDSKLVVATHGGDVVGMQPVTVRSFRRGDQRLTGAVFTGGMVHPGHRRRGLFTLLIRAAEQEAQRLGASAAVTMPNDASYPAFKKVGWDDLGEREVHLRATFLGVPKRTDQTPVALEEVPAFGPETVECDERSGSSRSAIGVARDAGWLAWRYRDNELYRYHRWQARDRSARLVGVLALSVMRVKGVSIGLLLDVLAGDHAVRAALLAAALRFLRAARVPALISVMSTAAVRRALGGLGFVRVPARVMPRGFHTMARALGSSPANQALPQRLDGWLFTLGDWDGV
jgi:GNAT superfamily N-acetyltransferase